MTCSCLLRNRYRRIKRRNDFRILVKFLQCIGMITIRDINGDVVPGCFTFDCGGFEVSCSTIAKPSEIVVFRRAHRKDGQAYRASCIENAVAWCQINQVNS